MLYGGDDVRALFTALLVACGAPAQSSTSPAPLPVASAAPSADPWTSAVLARSNATSPVPSSGLRLIVSKSAVSLADGTQVVPLPADTTNGIDAAYKRRGPNDLYIEPIGALAQAKSAHAAVLAVDPSTTYRVLVEVLFSLGQNEVSTIHLVVRSDAGMASIEPTLPHAPKVPTTTPLLGLVVLIVQDGISVKARGGNIAPGCKDAGAGLTIPNKDGARDFAALAACVDRVKHISPDFESETSVTIAANPGTDFQTLVTTMDALRPMFPNASFGLAR
jgi:biopolymer transport protein ExbD